MKIIQKKGMIIIEIYNYRAIMMEELILYIVKHLVNNPDDVQVTDGGMREDIKVYNLTVSEEDKGYVIGKQGRVAKALRSVVKAAASKNGEKINIDIL